jgi:histidinol-phosphate phosphatase family protein
LGKIQFHSCRKKFTLTEMNRAVFLDRDGTLIAEKNYLCRAEDVQILPGAGRALKKLSDAGYKLFIVSNQSGVGRGYFTLADVERVNEHLARELARDGVRFRENLHRARSARPAGPWTQAVAAVFVRRAR